MSSPASRALANSAQPSHQCPSRSVRFYARRLETTLVPQLRANASSAAWLNRNVGKIPRSSHLLRFRLSLCSEYLLRWAALQRYQLSPKGSFGPQASILSVALKTRRRSVPHRPGGLPRRALGRPRSFQNGISSSRLTSSGFSFSVAFGRLRKSTFSAMISQP